MLNVISVITQQNVSKAPGLRMQNENGKEVNLEYLQGISLNLQQGCKDRMWNRATKHTNKTYTYLLFY